MNLDDDGEDWTLVVERVLVAQTADLRELALLANADPETFYLGTRLDGVDICGQDLRGMHFSDLRLSHVKHDEGTLIDARWAISHARPISVLIASYDRNPRNIKEEIGRENIEVFTLSDSQIFSESINAGALGVIIASNFELYTATALARNIKDPHSEAIIIVSSENATESISYLTDASFNRDAIICIASGSSVRSSERSLDRDVALALGFVAEGNADLIRPHHGQCIFMRVIGHGALPVLDACCQIFERAWSAKIQCLELRLLSGDVRSESSEMLAVATLFDSRVSHSWVDRPFGLYGIIEVRRQNGYPTRYWEEQYQARVISSLEVLRPSERRSGLFSGIDNISLEEVRVARGRRRAISVAWHDVTQFCLKGVSKIAIVEKCDIAWVVYQLVEHNTLCVSARDILGIPLEDKISTWSIVGRQLDRFMGGEIGGGGARRRYLGILLKEAAAREPSASTWSAVLDDETTSIVVDSILVDPKNTILEFQLKFRSQGRRKVAHARFTAGPEGPVLEIPAATRKFSEFER
ncbi:hypothetical protein [Caulobacter sp.]|uniref:hypothetical protein n=1 Tax=Caulobacter sp. TaxID=78 RepID=UPI003BACBD91